MRDNSIDGLVLRTRDYGDHDRYLTVLTAEYGRITLLSKGSKSLKGGVGAISQPYTYSNFEYYRKGDFNILKGGVLHNSFYDLSRDIDSLNLASYLSDLCIEVTDEGEEAGEILRLMLNSFYALSKGLYPKELIKAAVEWRLATMSGYEPDLSCCAACGTPMAERFYLHVMNGALYCPACFKKASAAVRTPNAYDDLREAETLCHLTPAARDALLYCGSAPLSRLFAFDLPDSESLTAFQKAAETYILSHLGRGFDTLSFYHAMRQMAAMPTQKGTST